MACLPLQNNVITERVSVSMIARAALILTGQEFSHHILVRDSSLKSSVSRGRYTLTVIYWTGEDLLRTIYLDTDVLANDRHPNKGHFCHSQVSSLLHKRESGWLSYGVL